MGARKRQDQTVRQETVVTNHSTLPLSAASLSPGQIIGDFLILKKLGQGGIASVYLAREQSLEREVALKISDSLSEEGKTLARLDHPNIVRVYSDGTDSATGLRLCNVQVIDGPSLDKIDAGIPADINTLSEGFTGAHWLKLLNGENPTPDSTLSHRSALETLLRIGSLLARALAHAHEKGVLHLDIKPANILMDKVGQPYLADFNVSNLQNVLSSGLPSTFGGTPAYMSPEQKLAVESPCPKNFQLISSRSDVFSLARVLQRFAERTFPQSLLLLKRKEARPQYTREAPAAEFWSILRRASENEPAKRTASALLLAEELEHCLEYSRTLSAYPPQITAKSFEKGIKELRFSLLAPVLSASAYFYFLWFKDRGLGYHYRSSTYVAAYGGLFVGIAIAIGIYFYFRKRLTQCTQQPELDPTIREKARVAVTRLPFFYAFLNFCCWGPGFNVADPKLVANRIELIHLLPVCSFLVIFFLITSWNFGRLLQWTVGFAYPQLWRAMSHPSERAEKDLLRLRKWARNYRYLSIYFPLLLASGAMIRLHQNYDVAWQALFGLRIHQLLALIAYEVVASSRPLTLIERALSAVHLAKQSSSPSDRLRPTL